MKKLLSLTVFALLFTVLYFSANANEITPVRHPPILGGDDAMQKARKALDEKDYDKLKKIVDHNAGINDRTFTNGWRLLDYSADYGDAEAIRILLTRGANPNENPNNPPIIGTLIGLMNARTRFYPNPVPTNISIQYIEAMQQLIDGGSSINMKFGHMPHVPHYSHGFAVETALTLCRNEIFSPELRSKISSLVSKIPKHIREEVRSNYSISSHLSVNSISTSCINLF